MIGNCSSLLTQLSVFSVLFCVYQCSFLPLHHLFFPSVSSPLFSFIHPFLTQSVCFTLYVLCRHSSPSLPLQHYLIQSSPHRFSPHYPLLHLSVTYPSSLLYHFIHPSSSHHPSVSCLFFKHHLSPLLPCLSHPSIISCILVSPLLPSLHYSIFISPPLHLFLSLSLRHLGWTVLSGVSLIYRLSLLLFTLSIGSVALVPPYINTTRPPPPPPQRCYGCWLTLPWNTEGESGRERGELDGEMKSQRSMLGCVRDLCVKERVCWTVCYGACVSKCVKSSVEGRKLMGVFRNCVCDWHVKDLYVYLKCWKCTQSPCVIRWCCCYLVSLIHNGLWILFEWIKNAMYTPRQKYVNT